MYEEVRQVCVVMGWAGLRFQDYLWVIPAVDYLHMNVLVCGVIKAVVVMTRRKENSSI